MAKLKTTNFSIVIRDNRLDYVQLKFGFFVGLSPRRINSKVSKANTYCNDTQRLGIIRVCFYFSNF